MSDMDGTDGPGTDSISQLFESIRDGSVFQLSDSPTKWVEASVLFGGGTNIYTGKDYEGYASIRGELKAPTELLREWGYCMSPFQIALLRDAERGELGRGIVIVHEYGCIIELETWPRVANCQNA